MTDTTVHTATDREKGRLKTIEPDDPGHPGIPPHPRHFGHTGRKRTRYASLWVAVVGVSCCSTYASVEQHQNYLVRRF
jgi:hypothetical protein